MNICTNVLQTIRSSFDNGVFTVYKQQVRQRRSFGFKNKRRPLPCFIYFSAYTPVLTSPRSLYYSSMALKLCNILKYYNIDIKSLYRLCILFLCIRVLEAYLGLYDLRVKVYHI